MYNFSIDEEGNLIISKSIPSDNQLKIKKSSSKILDKKTGDTIYVYANEYILGITDQKMPNTKAKLLYSFRMEENSQSIKMKLPKHLDCLFKKDISCFSSSNGSFIFPFDKKYYGSSFLMMNAYGEFMETKNGDIKKLIGDGRVVSSGVAEYVFKNDKQVKLPYVEVSSSKDNKPYDQSLKLSNVGINQVNEFLQTPLEDNELLYLRPIVEDVRKENGEKAKVIYFLPINESRIKIRSKDNNLKL